MASFADENIWNGDVNWVGNVSRNNRTRNDKIGIDLRFVKFFGSAAAELRTLTPDLCNSILCSRVCPELSSFGKSCSIHPRRPTLSDSLEERFEKANLQWSLQPSPKTIFITEKRMLMTSLNSFTNDR